MTPDEALRALRRLRYSPRKGRRLGLTWVARMAGIVPTSLYPPMNRGSLSRPMVARLARAIAQIIFLSNGHIASVGALDDGRDPRGDWSRARKYRWKRRRRRRTAGHGKDTRSKRKPKGEDPQ